MRVGVAIRRQDFVAALLLLQRKDNTTDTLSIYKGLDEIVKIIRKTSSFDALTKEYVANTRSNSVISKVLFST